MTPELDSETKARIEAEEAYRAQVRAKIARPHPEGGKPSYWAGIILNVLAPGAGLILVRQAGVGAAWLLAAVFSVFVLPAWLVWPAAAIGSILHYNNVYDRLYPSPAQQEESERLSQMNMVFLWVIGGVILLAYFMWGRSP